MGMRRQEPWAGRPPAPPQLRGPGSQRFPPSVSLQNKERTFPAEEQNVCFQEL